MERFGRPHGSWRSWIERTSTELSSVASGDAVFIDANIFLYHFTGVSKECMELLKRCEAGEVRGWTALPVLAEVCHKLMAAEAVARGLAKPGRVVERLQRKPALVRKLSVYATQMVALHGWGISLVTPPADLILRSQVYRSRFGLLTNDSFIPILMREAGTDILASHDRVFETISSIRLARPRDIPWADPHRLA